MNVRRQDETFGDLSPASFDVPYNSFLLVSVKSYSQKSDPQTSDAEIPIVLINKLDSFKYRI